MGWRLWGWLPAIVLMGTIFYMSSQPAPEFFRKQYIFSQDKFVHVAAYFVLAACFARGFIWDGGGLDRRRAWIAAGLSAFYGMTDEFHQSFVPERQADFADWAADALGAVLLVPLSKPLAALLRWEERLFKRALAGRERAPSKDSAD